MILRFSLLVLVALFGFSIWGDVRAEHFDVYLLAGQSNMDGRGQADALSEAERAPVDDVVIYYRNELASSDGWHPLTTGFSIPPKHKKGIPSPTFGPEIGFARVLLQKLRDANSNAPRLAIIKGSRGGTSLRKDWNPGNHGDAQSQGPQYQDMLETIDLAITAIKQRGDTCTIRGLLWHQGESDSKSTAKLHQERLVDLVERFRVDLQIATLPVVLGQVYDNGKRDSVRQAITAVSSESDSIGLVSAKGLTTWDEGTHFDAASQLEMGARFATEMLRLQLEAEGDRIPKVVCFGDSITNRGYPNILGQMLNVEAINAGVGGNSTSDAMRRLTKDVLDQQPDVTVLFFGTNDTRVDNEKKHVPIAKYRANLQAMIDSCREIGSEVVLCTLPPINPEPYFTRHDRKVFGDAEGLSQLLLDYQLAAREVANASNVSLVDLQGLLAQEPSWLSRDGVHPSEAGNRILAKLISAAVRPLLPNQNRKESISE